MDWTTVAAMMMARSDENGGTRESTLYARNMATILLPAGAAPGRIENQRSPIQASRFSKTIDFPSYSAADLSQILDGMAPATVQYMVSRIPLGRTGTIDEVAGLVHYLVSSEASFTTGQCYDISGGRATY